MKTKAVKRATKPRRKAVPKITVLLIEHDGWSGAKVIERHKFTLRGRAMKYVATVNAQNVLSSVPCTYYTAEIEGEGLFSTVSR